MRKRTIKGIDKLLNRFPRQLRLQLGVMVSLLLVVAIALHSWHTIRVQSGDATTAIQHQTAIIAKNIANLSVNYLLTEDLAPMETLLIRIAEFPNIESISISDEQGTVLSRVMRSRDEGLLVDYAPEELTPPDDTVSHIHTVADRMTIWHPIAEGTLMGWIKIDYNLHALSALQKRIWRDSFIAGVLVVTVSIVLILLFLNRHILAVRRITHFAQQLGEQKGETIRVDTSSEEIEQLMSALNDASVRLYRQNCSIKESAERLEHLRRQNVLILESADEGILGLDLTGKHTFVNTAAATLLGYEIGELIGQPIYKICHRRETDAPLSGQQDCPIYDALGREDVHRVDGEVFWRKDGTSIPVEYAATPIKENEKMTGAVVTFRDITARRQAEEALKESEERYRLLVELSPDAIVLHSEGKIIFVNKVGARMIGMEKTEDLTGKPIMDYIHPDSRHSVRERIQRMVTEGIILPPDDVRFVRVDGTILEAEVSSVPCIYQNKPAVLVAIRDLSERKKLEAQLRHAQKMEAVGQLAGGIAHDFNNILTAIIGYGNFLRLKMDKDDPRNHTVDQILSSSDRAARLTYRLLAYSRQQIIAPKPADFKEIIKSVERFLSRLIGEDIELVTSFADDVMTVMADSGQIDQVLINLVTNARDAMPDGGRLVIETTRFEMTADFINAHGYGEPGPYAMMSISDTGAGMDEASMKRIFEPFFTTKEVGKGTGLGLAIIYGIVKQHNGYITVESEKGTGTTFTLYLPLIRSAVAEAEPGERASFMEGTETVLLAEDDNEVRDLSKFVLEEFGYTVVEAVNGDEAIEQYMKHRETVKLVILDVIMPRKNGKEVYEKIRSVDPDRKVLFMSGYAADVIHQKGILEEEFRILSKPVSPKDFLKKVRETLDQ